MKARWLSVLGAGAAALLVCGQARAVTSSGSDAASRVGAEAGGGLSNFTGDLGDHTNLGPSWNARGIVNITPNIGIEGVYQGANNQIDDVRLPTAHNVTTTAFSGDIKLTAPFAMGATTVFEPFVSGGLGGAHYSVNGGDNAYYVSSGSFQIPAAIGANVLFNQLVTVGARADYLANTHNTLGTTSNGNQWATQATLGVHY
ncbi:MAG: outer membrane beta-barrel protein [Deltaproteobacteria bacterium]|nr:outer membrane beta-barrel protein [Deltaproteobacteria bacterium]